MKLEFELCEFLTARRKQVYLPGPLYELGAIGPNINGTVTVYYRKRIGFHVYKPRRTPHKMPKGNYKVVFKHQWRPQEDVRVPLTAVGLEERLPLLPFQPRK